MKKRRQRGFTLIELMVVVAIIGILASIAIPLFNRALYKSRLAEQETLIKTFENEVFAYIGEHNEWPGTSNTIWIAPWNPPWPPTAIKRDMRPIAGWTGMTTRPDQSVYTSFQMIGFRFAGAQYLYVYAYTDADGDGVFAVRRRLWWNLGGKWTIWNELEHRKGVY